MRKCDTPCIANVDGQCAVENCGGPIVRIGHKKPTPLEEAAKIYVMSRQIFETEFQKVGDVDAL